MALNFLGLGFSFGAKDLGLKKMQATMIAGFTSMSLEIRRLNESLSGVKLGSIVEQLPTPVVNEQADAIRNLADSMAGTLPAASDEASYAMDRAGKSAETGGRKIASSLTGMGDLGDSTKRVFSDLSSLMRETLPDAMRRSSDSFTKDGLSIWRMERNIRDGFDWIRQATDKLNSILQINKLQLFIQSLDLLKLNNVGNAIQQMVSDGGQLTTSLEAQAASYNKTARTIATSMSGSASDVRRFSGQMTSMAIGLNVDVTAVGQAFAAVHRTTGDVAKLGFRDMRTLVQATQVLGMSADDLVGMMQNLQVSWGLSTEQARGLVDEVTAIGQSMGFGVGAVQNMQRTIAAMDEQFAQFAQTNPEQVRRLVLSTTALQGAYIRMGMSEEQAGAAATDLLKKLTMERVGFERMFTGLQSELPALSQEFGITTGDISASFDLLREDPLQFAMSMRDMTKRVEESGGDASWFMTRMSQVLTEHLGPSFAWLAKGAIDPAMGSLQELSQQIAGPGGIAGSGGAFDRMVRNGFTTGRTLQENMDLMRENFILNLRKMNRETVHRFVRNTGEAFKEWGDRLTALAKEDGPLGALARKMIMVQQVGAKALLPETLWPMAEVFGQLLQVAGPFVGMLGVMGLRFNFLLSPLGLVGGAIGGLVFAMRSLTSHNIENDATMRRLREGQAEYQKQLRNSEEGSRDYARAQQGLASVENLIAKRQEHLREQAAAQARQQIIDFFKSLKEKVPIILGVVKQAAIEVWQLLRDFFKQVNWGEVLNTFVRMGSAIWNALVGVFDAIDWGKVFSVIGSGIKTALPVIGDFFVDLGEGLWMGISGQFDPNSSQAAQSGVYKIAGYIGQSLKLAVTYAWDFFTQKVIPFVLDFVHGLFAGLIYGADPSKGGKTKAQQMGLAIGAWIQHALVVAWGWLTDYMSKWWDKITEIWTDPSATFMDKLKATFANSAGIIIGAYALYKFTPVFGVLKTVGKVGFEAGKVLYQGMRIAVQGATMAVQGVAYLGAKLTTMVSGAEMASTTLGRLGQTMMGIWRGAKALLTKVVELGAALAFRLMGGTKLALDGMGQMAPTMAAASKSAGGFTGLIPQMVAGLKAVGLAMWTSLGPWGLLLAAIAAVSVALAIAFPEDAKAGLGKVWNSVKSTVSDIWNDLKGFVQGVALMFKGLWDVLSNGAVIFKNAVSAVFQILAGVIKVIFYDLVLVIGTPFRVGWGIIQSFVAFVKAIFQTLYYFFTGQWGKLGEVWSGFVNKIGAIWESVWNFISEVFMRIVDGITGIGRAFFGFFTSSWEAIKGLAKGVFDAITGFGYALFNALKGAIDIFKLPFVAAFEFLSSFASDIWRSIRSAGEEAFGWISDIWSGIEDLGKDLYRWFVEPVVDAFKEIQSWGEWLYDNTIGIFADVGEYIYDLFSSSPQDAPIQAFQDIGFESETMRDIVVYNFDTMSGVIEGTGQAIKISFTDATDTAMASLGHLYYTGREGIADYVNSMDGGMATITEFIQKMGDRGVEVSADMVADMVEDANRYAREIYDATLVSTGSTEKAAEAATDAFKRMWDESVQKADEAARQVAEIQRTNADQIRRLYEGTSSAVRDAFKNSMTSEQKSFILGLENQQDFVQESTAIMSTATRRIADISADQAAQIMGAAADAAKQAYEEVLASGGDIAAAQSAALGEYRRTAESEMDQIAESAREASRATVASQESITQTASQELLDTPRITSRTVRQIADELKVAMQIIKAQMDALVIWVSGFAAGVLGKINEVINPLMERITTLTTKMITKISEVSLEAVGASDEMMRNADAALTKMETDLTRTTRVVAQKAMTAADSAIMPALGLPKLIEEEVTTKIANLFITMWDEILRSTEGTLGLLTQEMGSLISDLRLASVIHQGITAMRRAQQADMQAAMAGGTYVAPETMPGRVADLNDVVDAVHHPAWYDEYQGVFQNQMSNLADAIRGSRARGGNQSPTRQQTRPADQGGR